MPLLMRSLIGIYTFLASQWVLQYLPLSIAFVIQQTQPFFTMVFAAFMVGEAIKGNQVGLMATSFIGMIMIESSQASASTGVSDLMYRIAVFVQISVAIGSGLQAIFIRRMKQLHFAVLQFNYFLISVTLESFLLTPAVHTKRTPLVYA